MRRKKLFIKCYNNFKGYVSARQIIEFSHFRVSKG